MTSPAAAWQHVRHVLAIRLGAMDDVLMCTPAMRAIKDSNPHRALTLLASASGAVAADHVPEVDAVIAYAAPWMEIRADPGLQHDLRLIEALRAERFDGAVIFTSCSQSPQPAALLCRLAGIPLTLAYCREHAGHLLSHRVPDPEPERMLRHEVQRQLDLVASIGWQTCSSQLSFAVPRHAPQQVQHILARHGVPVPAFAGPPAIVIHPAASAPAHRYPAQLWAEVADALHARYHCLIIACGDRAEWAMVHAIASQCRAGLVNLAGELTLGQLGALITMASVLVANNSGPTHIAAALGTPVVCLYPLINPRHTPWQVANRVLQRDVPCRLCNQSVCCVGCEPHHGCLARVDPEHVFEAVAALLEQHSAGGAVAGW